VGRERDVGSQEILREELDEGFAGHWI
jgi:hypothetical protein